MTAILGERAITRRRYPSAPAVGSDGRPVYPSAVDDTILGSLQPLSGRELQILPELERQRSQWKLYTVSDLRTTDPVTGLVADRVVDGATVYEVHQVEPQEAVIPNYKVRLVQLKEPG